MALDLTNSAVDRVRVRLGDVHCPYILEDATIEYYLSKNANNENRSYRELLTVVLFSLSRLTRERAGDVEVYGLVVFVNVLKIAIGIIANASAVFALFSFLARSEERRVGKECRL